MNEKLHEAMYNFQYLELMLRGALRRFEDLIEDKMKGILNYQVDDDAIDNLPLGLLAKRYVKYTNNNKFKSEVGEVINARNQLAHRLFLSVEDNKGSFPEGFSKDVEAVLLHGDTAARLGDEVFTMMQHYYFDPVAQEWHVPS